MTETSREKVLGMIRHRLGVSSEDQTRLHGVNSRLAEHPSNTVPKMGQLEGEVKIERFIQEAENRGVQVHRVAKLANAFDVIENLQSSTSGLVIMTPGAENLGLDIASLVHEESHGVHQTVELCISTCLCGIAETGTIVLRGDEFNATTDVFLSDTHIVLLASEDIECSMEAVWQRVRREQGLPRHLTMISGPSSTGDIEMIMEKGVHGPRDLQVILWDQT